MVMTLWWVTLLILALALVLGLLALRWRRRRLDRPPLHVANSEYLDRLPAVQRARLIGQILRYMSAAAAVALVLTTAVLSGRVATERVESPQNASRDIVLCLDVSGSMVNVDAELLRTFDEIVEGFDGERVALTIFDGRGVTVFPLTNDYGLIQRQLDAAVDVFPPGGVRSDSTATDNDREVFVEQVYATQLDSDASLIGDGLTSCAQQFDRADQTRSRFIIFATDNEVGYNPVFTLPEGADAAISREATVFTLYPGGFGGASAREELRQETERTGGQMFVSGKNNSVSEITHQIQNAQASTLEGTPRVLRTDKPMTWFLLSSALLGVLIAVSWRRS